MTSGIGAKSCKIVVPIHRSLTDFETATVKHNLSVLSDYEAVLVGPLSKAEVLHITGRETQENPAHKVTTELFDDSYFEDVLTYSHLLLSHEFYARFEDVSHILICQPDAFVFEDTLRSWLNLDYAFIGSPVFKGFDKPSHPLEFTGMLNGGLSLRNVLDAKSALGRVLQVRKSRFTRVARVLGLMAVANFITRMFGKPIVVSPKDAHEDVVWTGPISEALSEFKTPSLEVATRFAFETAPAEMYELNGQNLPFGCHAFGVYDPVFWKAHFPEWAQEYLSERS